MKSKERVSLCTECDMCPEVQLYDNKVLIGEEGNIVKLNVNEWNTLVEKIINKELGKL